MPGLFFSLFSSFQYTVDRIQMFKINKFLPMTGFEPRTSGIGSNRSTNWATTTSLVHCYWFQIFYFDCNILHMVTARSRIGVVWTSLKHELIRGACHWCYSSQFRKYVWKDSNIVWPLPNLLPKNSLDNPLLGFVVWRYVVATKVPVLIRKVTSKWQTTFYCFTTIATKVVKYICPTHGYTWKMKAICTVTTSTTEKL